MWAIRDSCTRCVSHGKIGVLQRWFLDSLLELWILQHQIPLWHAMVTGNCWYPFLWSCRPVIATCGKFCVSFYGFWQFLFSLWHRHLQDRSVRRSFSFALHRIQCCLVADVMQVGADINVLAGTSANPCLLQAAWSLAPPVRFIQRLSMSKTQWAKQPTTSRAVLSCHRKEVTGGCCGISSVSALSTKALFDSIDVRIYTRLWICRIACGVGKLSASLQQFVYPNVQKLTWRSLARYKHLSVSINEQPLMHCVALGWNYQMKWLSKRLRQNQNK